ncbi:MAG TPA: hypothetical protein PKD09_07920 [Aggregatilinea sp.]|nr:hypothetical protein [Aggregatilinea sp.]HML21557.1 hypothetical protein [Aggregatilinea sp.]
MRRLQQDGQQQAGQGEVPQVIRAKLCFETVLRLAVRRGHDARVVHQHVQASVRGSEIGRKPVYRIQAAQVQGQHVDRRARRTGEQIAPGALRLGHVAAGHDDMRSLAGERDCAFVTDAAVGSGDKDDFAGLVRNVVYCPAHEVLSVLKTRGGLSRSPMMSR